MCSNTIPPKFNCDGSLGAKPIEFQLPVDGYHKGVLWAGLAENWRHVISYRIIEGQLVSEAWIGDLVNSSSN
jgi:hypothetical protein